MDNARAGQSAAWVDDEGRPLPESVCPAFRERPKFDQLCRRVGGLVRDVERLGQSPAAVHLDVGEVSGPLKTASQKLAAARPSRLCQHQPDAGAACENCRGHGWIPAGNKASR